MAKLNQLFFLRYNFYLLSNKFGTPPLSLLSLTLRCSQRSLFPSMFLLLSESGLHLASNHRPRLYVIAVFSDDRYLKCALHPLTVLTEETFNCADHRPISS